jgi:hypothetical protein
MGEADDGLAGEQRELELTGERAAVGVVEDQLPGGDGEGAGDLDEDVQLAEHDGPLVAGGDDVQARGDQGRRRQRQRHGRDDTALSAHGAVKRAVAGSSRPSPRILPVMARRRATCQIAKVSAPRVSARSCRVFGARPRAATRRRCRVEHAGGGLLAGLDAGLVIGVDVDQLGVEADGALEQGDDGAEGGGVEAVEGEGEARSATLGGGRRGCPDRSRRGSRRR